MLVIKHFLSSMSVWTPCGSFGRMINPPPPTLVSQLIQNHTFNCNPARTEPYRPGQRGTPLAVQAAVPVRTVLPKQTVIHRVQYQLLLLLARIQLSELSLVLSIQELGQLGPLPTVFMGRLLNALISGFI